MDWSIQGIKGTGERVALDNREDDSDKAGVTGRGSDDYNEYEVDLSKLDPGIKKILFRVEW